MRKKTMIMIAGLSLALASASLAAALESINLQGVLTDADGLPVYGTHDVSFSLYDQETGGTALLEQSYESMEFGPNGRYQVDIDLSGFPGAAIELAQPLWIEVSIDAQPLSPRLPVQTVIYSMVAGAAVMTPDSPVTWRNQSDGGALWTMTAEEEGDLELTVQPEGGEPRAVMAVDDAGNISLQGSEEIKIGDQTVESTLEMASRISFKSQHYGQTVLCYYGGPPVGTPESEGVRIRYGSEYLGGTRDALIIEKTDGGDLNPDGGVVFLNTGRDGIEESALTIRGSGRVGVGIDTPSCKLDVDGNVCADNISMRERDLDKDDIAPIDDALRRIGNLTGVQYVRRNGPATGVDDGPQRQFGLMVEDVRAEFPELVDQCEDGDCAAINYGRLNAVLVEAVKELTERNRALEERNRNLESRVSAIEALVGDGDF